MGDFHLDVISFYYVFPGRLLQEHQEYTGDDKEAATSTTAAAAAAATTTTTTTSATPG